MPRIFVEYKNISGETKKAYTIADQSTSKVTLANRVRAVPIKTRVRTRHSLERHLADTRHEITVRYRLDETSDFRYK